MSRGEEIAQLDPAGNSLGSTEPWVDTAGAAREGEVGETLRSNETWGLVSDEIQKTCVWGWSPFWRGGQLRAEVSSISISQDSR